MEQNLKNEIVKKVKEWINETYPSWSVYNLKNVIRFEYGRSAIKEKINSVAFWDLDYEITIDEVNEIYEIVIA